MERDESESGRRQTTITLYIKATADHPHTVQPYYWTNKSKDQYQTATKNLIFQSHLYIFLSTSYSLNDDILKQAVQNINNIFDHLANLTNLKRPPHHRKKGLTNNEWFDTKCRQLRKVLRNASNQKYRQSDNPELRFQYWETEKLSELKKNSM